MVYGHGGTDWFGLGGSFTRDDRINGGGGDDTLTLNGDYSAGVHLAPKSIVNIEQISLVRGHDYKLVTDDGNVAAGQTLTVDGGSLGAGDNLIFNGHHETDGRLVISGGNGEDILLGGSQADTLSGGGSHDVLRGGAQNDTLKGQGGNDTIRGGGGNDTLNGGLGADHMTGDAGQDVFVYGATNQSTGAAYDTITDFDATADHLDMPGTVTGIDATVSSGALSSGSFNGDLSSAVGAGQLAAHHAVLFTPDSGSLSGETFLIVDANGVAGYQAGQDFVIDITGATHLASLSTADFI